MHWGGSSTACPSEEKMLENSVVQAESGPQERIAVALEDLWHAIEEDQFLPHFQPKVNLLGMELAGVEALMRWRHPQHGLLTAGTFLPLIADNFLFDELGVIMLEKSVAACRAWQGLGINVPVSVNLSPDLLRDPGLTARLEEKVRAHGLPAHRLIIEVSEAGIAHEASEALDNLVHLRAAGFGLSIDDFGTGHIEPDQLARIPANELKIDRKMLAGAARRPALRELLVQAVQTARELNFIAVAEGVETREEWDLVNELGCDMAQGYFIARPMPGQELGTWVEAWRGDPFV
jgi:EAL domain-containing protein (putative c-di-GMP-specific phosphodiesterase class I)